MSIRIAVATMFIALCPIVQADVSITIGTVNNADMIIMQRLSRVFEKQNPDISLNWVILEENILRQRLTTDIATGGGQFDVVTIGTYEVPIWANKGWLVPLDNLPTDYDVEDILKSVRDGLSSENLLYALPFYAESSMTFFNTKLFDAQNVEMPEQPTWAQIRQLAAKIHDPSKGVFGICARGKPGWGENMALVSTMVNTFGGRWFDEQWRPELNSVEWQEAVSFYVDLLKSYGPPGASSNGFNENLALFSSGKCGVWVDATAAGGRLFDSDASQIGDMVGFANAPVASSMKGKHWLWSWALAIPESSKSQEAARRFILWATSREYVRMVAEAEGWAAVPPGTRRSTYENSEYLDAAPFAQITLTAIESADPTDSTLEPSPYDGIQYVAIPEFQAIGTQVGQHIAGALSGQSSVAESLQASQALASRTMLRAGYPK